MNGIPYIDILILAMIAVFIIQRLRNVLGKKTGNESDILDKFTGSKQSYQESEPDETIKPIKQTKQNVIKNKQLHKDPKINNVLKKIYQYDKEFSIDDFLKGAKKAFEFIIGNYVDGKIDDLKKLLSKKMFDNFKSQISYREKKGEKLDITFIGVELPKLISAEIYNRTFARMKLEFVTEQVQTTKNSNGKIIDGDINQILNITELWTFTKNIKDKNPNWVLEKIEESAA